MSIQHQSFGHDTQEDLETQCESTTLGGNAPFISFVKVSWCTIYGELTYKWWWEQVQVPNNKRAKN